MDTKLLLELIDTEINGLLGITEEKGGGKSFDIQAAWDSIPLPQISELGWADPKKKGGAPTNQQRAELAQYIEKIPGRGLNKIITLSKVLEDPSKELRGKSLSQILSFMTFYKTMTFIISDFNPSTAGFLFESILGTLTGGAQIAAKGAGGGDTIADFSFQVGGKEKYISLKLLTEGATEVDGSFRDLVDDLVQKGEMTYIVVLKRLEGGEGSLEFYEFTFDKPTFLRLTSNSKSGRDNIRCLRREFRSKTKAPVAAASQFFNWNQWLETKGMEMLLQNFEEEAAKASLANMRSQQKSGTNPPPAKKVQDAELLGALVTQFEADKEEATASMEPIQKGAKIDESSFMTYEETLKYLNTFQDDKTFWEALQNFSLGYLGSKKFNFTQGMIKEEAGGAPFATLKVGKEVVQETLNSVVNETNERMFKIFQTLQVLSENLRGFFMKDMDSQMGNEAKNAAGRIHKDTTILVKGGSPKEK
jgi:hypothetical protein